MSTTAASFRRILRGLRRDEAATTAAEFALVLPFFLIIVFGTISTGLAMSAASQMQYAAQRSARCLAVNVTAPCTAANIDTYAKGWYKGPGLTGLVFTASDQMCGTQICGKQVTGNATYSIIAGIQKTAVTLSAKASYPVI